MPRRPPQDVSAAFEEALARVRASLERGDVQAAVEQATLLLGDEASHARALLQLCLLFTAAGVHEEALKLSDRMARLAPDTPETRSCNACCLFNAGRTAQAHSEALAALGLDPENLDALRTALKSSLQGVNDPGLEAHAATLLREGDRLQDAALVLAYLASTSRGAPFGVVFAHDATLTGFALGLAAPGEVCGIELWLGEFKLARLAADQDHPALRMAGLPDGHAFVGRIPPELLGVELALRLPSGTPCVGSPLRPADSATPVEGCAVTEGGNVIAGHAWRRCAPGKRLLVELEGESGRRVRVAASRFREELLEAGVHDGGHGFSVPWPLPEGVACEAVAVRECTSGQPLQGSPVLVFDPGLLAAALQDLNGWLRLAGERPDAPPPLPESCRGRVLGLLRDKQARWIRELDALAARDDQP